MKEALKMALEALETPRPFDDYPPLWRAYKKTINEAITAIKKALAQPYQEPVAWMCQSAGYIALAHNKPDQSLNPLPIYLAPPPCPTCEALARTVMLDQTSHDAQRKPLTKNDILAIGGVVAHGDVFFINIKQLNQLVGIKE